ncbi:hypothetical protein GHNINEIG_01014 [Hydrogenovibrio crunogenus]|uniref:Lipoprotein n=1 Tax=Hydrogenovibrio crunogenus TaxID=39765 RepID=A0A4P7NYX8_9GAMM|nr:hypothetical protein [Hydrogenovibrio crunogenus]QBZ82973.1 hypothetical protein GHNINEIG_01014 [Hydrogenovibrio crunogenus]
MRLNQSKLVSLFMLFSFAFGTLSLTGCSDSAEDNMKETYQEAKEDMGEAAEDTQEAVEDAGESVEDAAEAAEDKMEE